MYLCILQDDFAHVKRYNFFRQFYKQIKLVISEIIKICYSFRIISIIQVIADNEEIKNNITNILS